MAGSMGFDQKTIMTRMPARRINKRGHSGVTHGDEPGIHDAARDYVEIDPGFATLSRPGVTLMKFR